MRSIDHEKKTFCLFVFVRFALSTGNHPIHHIYIITTHRLLDSCKCSINPFCCGVLSPVASFLIRLENEVRCAKYLTLSLSLLPEYVRPQHSVVGWAELGDDSHPSNDIIIMGASASTLCCPPKDDGDDASSRRKQQQQQSRRSRGCPEASIFCPPSPLEPVKPEPMLKHVHFMAGCNTIQEHNHKIRQALHDMEKLRGQEGLKAIGLEYRRFCCVEHQGLADKTLPAASAQLDRENQQVPCDDSLDEEESSPSRSTMVPRQPMGDRTATSETAPCSVDSLPSMALQPTAHFMAPVSTQSSPNAQEDDSVDVASDGMADNSNVDDKEQEDVVYEIPLRREDSDNDAEIRSTSSVIGTGDHLTLAESILDDFASVDSRYCINCRRKLLHTATDTVLDASNRADFIADGVMYNRVAELCMDVAHEIMCQEYDLEWAQVAPSSHNGERPEIRALVSKENSDETKTGALFICTGRGAVRAGIFSRQAMVYGEGLEVGCAWHLLREAHFRRLRVIIPDPNCRGDRWGYDVMRQTLRRLWPGDKNEDVYMVIHSAAGSHVQRLLLDTPDSIEIHLPQIKAVALTDSTHNLQWSKKQQCWHDFWESERCIYFKSAQAMRDAVGNRWYLHAAGKPIQTDSFWKHRFGKIQTCWAGTDVHSMTNWFAHQPMWKHIDRYWTQQQEEKNKENSVL